MFETFARRFTATSQVATRSPESAETWPVLQRLFDKYGGTTFNEGLYRVHDAVSSGAATRDAAVVYPALKIPWVCFGYDWLGRQFALDYHRGTADNPEVVMLEPGTGEILEVPATFEDFHDYALLEYQEACLAPEFFGEWRAHGGDTPRIDQCIGYKTPLFLGGIDDVSNLEISDLDVYWAITGQLITSTRNLPSGTRVSGLGLTY